MGTCRTANTINFHKDSSRKSMEYGSEIKVRFGDYGRYSVVSEPDPSDRKEEGSGQTCLHSSCPHGMQL